MKQYLELMKKVLDEGTPKMTVPEPARSPFLATRCASTCKKASRW